MKLIVNLIVFALGGAVGVYWGVNHPTAAQNIHDTEQRQMLNMKAAASEAKIEVLKKVSGDHPDPGYQRMISDEQKSLDDTNKQIAQVP